MKSLTRIVLSLISRLLALIEPPVSQADLGPLADRLESARDRLAEAVNLNSISGPHARISKGLAMATPELDRLTNEVVETETVVDSAITLLGNLSQIIRDNASNPAALTALADTLDAKQQQLADAIVANTPAA